MINIYCDESCHLEYDNKNIMVLGGISCSELYKKQIYNDIRLIKMKHGLSSWFEIKWTKVSMQYIDFYKELITYFFENPNLGFRAVIAKNKTQLDHKKYNNDSYDLWYYKMYFFLLDPMISAVEEYKILIDIKDTRGGPKIKKLQEVLCNNIYDFNGHVIKNISQIKSHDSEIMQLTDLLIGAISFYHRNLHENADSSQGKTLIIEELQYKRQLSLYKSTSRNENKFNLFIWEPRRFGL